MRPLLLLLGIANVIAALTLFANGVSSPGEYVVLGLNTMAGTFLVLTGLGARR